MTPRCARCGSTRDLRSLHGPCGKCAFEKDAQLAGLVDELQKIAIAGFVQNLGTRIVTTLRAAPSAAMTTARAIGSHVGSAPADTVAAVKGLRRPGEAMKRGWRAMWDPSMGQGGGKWSGALGTAMTALPVATAIPKDDPMGQGESRTTRMARAVGGGALGLAGGAHGIIPGIALGIAGDAAGGAVGKTIDRVRGRRPVKPKKPETNS